MSSYGSGRRKSEEPLIRRLFLPKKALMRPVDSENPDSYYADLEKEMLQKINELGIGPQGFGGRTTAVGLKY